MMNNPDITRNPVLENKALERSSGGRAGLRVNNSVAMPAQPHPPSSSFGSFVKILFPGIFGNPPPKLLPEAEPYHHEPAASSSFHSPSISARGNNTADTCSPSEEVMVATSTFPHESVDPHKTHEEHPSIELCPGYKMRITIPGRKSILVTLLDIHQGRLFYGTRWLSHFSRERLQEGVTLDIEIPGPEWVQILYADWNKIVFQRQPALSKSLVDQFLRKEHQPEWLVYGKEDDPLFRPIGELSLPPATSKRPRSHSDDENSLNGSNCGRSDDGISSTGPVGGGGDDGSETIGAESNGRSEDDRSESMGNPKKGSEDDVLPAEIMEFVREPDEHALDGDATGVSGDDYDLGGGDDGSESMGNSEKGSEDDALIAEIMYIAREPVKASRSDTSTRPSKKARRQTKKGKRSTVFCHACHAAILTTAFPMGVPDNSVAFDYNIPETFSKDNSDASQINSLILNIRGHYINAHEGKAFPTWVRCSQIKGRSEALNEHNALNPTMIIYGHNYDAWLKKTYAKECLEFKQTAHKEKDHYEFHKDHVKEYAEHVHGNNEENIDTER